MTAPRWAATRNGARDAAAADGDLVARAADGDRFAFDALIEGRIDRLFRMAYAITRSESDARDATQEACVLAWRHLSTLRDSARFDAWLSQVLVNACRGLLRGQRQRMRREVSLDGERMLADAGRTAGSEEGLGEADVIRAAFARLAPEARALLVLHHVEGKSLADVGRIVGAPVGTIKWRLWRARQALERALEAEAL